MAQDGAVSRDELARQAEKHLRQGRTDLAIELYDRLAQLAPTDWNTVKQLADLLERAGQREAAAGRFLQCADHHFEEGFHAKAAALYRKVLKLEPQSEHALCQLAEVSLALKLKADARQALGQVLALRRRRGDAEGAEAVSRRLAELEPDDPRHRSMAPPVPAPAAAPSPEEVTERLRAVARDAEARGDADGADRAWLAVLQRDPADRTLRGRLVRASLDRQDVEAARGLVEPLEGDAADVVAWRFELALLGGRGDLAKALAARIAPRQGGDTERVHEVREALRTRSVALGDSWCSRVVEALAQQGREAEAAALIELADARHPLPVECHLRWVELCVDAGLDGLDRAQTALASAYLRSGQPDLARAVADDLLLRRPDLESVRALVRSIHEACGMPDLDDSWTATEDPATDVDSWDAPTAVFEAAPSLAPPPLCPSAVSPAAVPPLSAVTEPVLPDLAAFDWGALLGREPVPAPAPPAPDPPAAAPLSTAAFDTVADDPPAVVDDVLAAVDPEASLVAEAPVGPMAQHGAAAEHDWPVEPPPPEFVEPWTLPPVDAAEAESADEGEPYPAFASAPPDADEIDLTDLLEELRPQQGPVMPEPVSAPAPPGDGRATPGGFVDGDGDAATDAREAPPGMLAAQQVAAGRVFAAAGLAAEAARAFERASKDVRSRFEAAEALAELHRSRGQLTEAVRWYDEATQAPVADHAVRRPVLYDLAETLEAVGQPDRALAVLLDLLSEVEDYRDARARADRLLRVDAGG